MKCQKCGYISFDDNRMCPKCGKDLDGEREKMNLASYRPAPISASGLLTEDPGETENLALTGSPEVSGSWEQIQDTGSPEAPLIVGATESTSMHKEGVEIHLESQSEGKQGKGHESISAPETPSDDGIEDLLLTLEDLGLEDSETRQDQLGQTIGDKTGLEPLDVRSIEKQNDNNLSLDLEPFEIDLKMEKPENKSS